LRAPEIPMLRMPAPPPLRMPELPMLQMPALPALLAPVTSPPVPLSLQERREPFLPKLPALPIPEVAVPAAAATPMTSADRLSADRLKPVPPSSLLGEGRRGPVSTNETSNNSITINLHYAPVLNGARPEDFDARKHADSIVRIVKDTLVRERRLKFE